MEQIDPMTTNKKITDQFTLACTSGLVMFACAAGYGGYFFLRNFAKPGMYLGVILGLPAIATILFLLTTLLIPGLLAPKRLVFPLTVTLPLVFTALLLLTVMLLTSTGNGLIIPFDRLRVAKFWEMPAVLTLVAMSQIACLTVLAALTKPVE